MLDEFLDMGDSSAARVPATVTKVSSPGPLKGKLNYSHKAMIDLILASPGISQNALAAHFGYSASWVSTVMSSDAFQMAFAERANEIIDPSLRLTVEERFKGMVARSMEILMEKLSLPAHQVPDQLALRAFELSSRAAGYGAKAEPVAVQVNVANHLEILGDNLTKLLQRKKAEVSDPTEDDS
jgi:hypothetical protein